MLVRRAATAIGRNIGVTRGFIEGVFSREQALVIVVGIGCAVAQLVLFPSFIVRKRHIRRLICSVTWVILVTSPPPLSRASRVWSRLHPAPDHTRKSLCELAAPLAGSVTVWTRSVQGPAV